MSKIEKKLKMKLTDFIKWIYRRRYYITFYLFIL